MATIEYYKHLSTIIKEQILKINTDLGKDGNLIYKELLQYFEKIDKNIESA